MIDLLTNACGRLVASCVKSLVESVCCIEAVACEVMMRCY